MPSNWQRALCRHHRPPRRSRKRQPRAVRSDATCTAGWPDGWPEPSSGGSLNVLRRPLPRRSGHEGTPRACGAGLSPLIQTRAPATVAARGRNKRMPCAFLCCSCEPLTCLLQRLGPSRCRGGRVERPPRGVDAHKYAPVEAESRRGHRPDGGHTGVYQSRTGSARRPRRASARSSSARQRKSPATASRPSSGASWTGFCRTAFRSARPSRARSSSRRSTRCSGRARRHDGA